MQSPNGVVTALACHTQRIVPVAMNKHWLTLIGAVLMALLTTRAHACDRVEYAEAKTWSNEQLQRAYCATDSERFNRVKDEIAGKAPFTKTDFDACNNQLGLYERLLKARGKAVRKCTTR